MEGQLKNALQKHLKGVASSTLDNITARLKLMPADRVLLVIDLAASLAAISLRSSIDFLMAVPETNRYLGPSELRVWGETGKRLAATSPDAAQDFFQSSVKIISAIAPPFRLRALTLISRQAALSTNLALECFKSFPTILESFSESPLTARILNICYEVSQHSVKHSCDLLKSAPMVIKHLEELDDSANLIDQVLELTASFVHRSGGTAAEFFTAIPDVLTNRTRPAWQKLFEFTYAFLDKSGGVALQYFRAAGKILSVADKQAFEKWTQLSLSVVSQGNATGYHFLKISPKILGALARTNDDDKNAGTINSVLDIVIQISNTNAASAVECFKASPFALRQASLDQFRNWAINGLERYGKDSRRAQAYYALESNGSRAALYNYEGGLRLDAVAPMLRLYIEGLTGRELAIKPIGDLGEEYKINDGRTIALPAAITEFEDETSNFKLYKALAAHAAGQVEFGTYAENFPELLAAQTETIEHFSKRNGRRPAQTANINFVNVLDHFPEKELARRIFTSVENGRIDRRLREIYRGLRRELDFVRERLAQGRPDLRQLPKEVVPFELLFQIAILGGITHAAREIYPGVAEELERIFEYYIQPTSSVADTLVATLRVYDLVERLSEKEELETESEQTSDQEEEEMEGEAGGEPGAEEEPSERRANVSNISEPFSYWTPSSDQFINPSEELFNSLAQETEMAEQGLEQGDKAFFYDEWDRELGDYRTRWCRVIERRNTYGSRSFVDNVRGRYAGVISSVRHQFQLLRPENLRRVINELDGEDYNLEALIDYAIDRRSSGRVSERLYTRKLRRQRDVVVSFLLDMSSSTARTISRYPNQPYTKPGQRIIDIEKEGLVLMSEALEAVGDGYSIQGFTSEGRRNVKFYVIKDFEERYTEEVERRIGGIGYQNNTRLGAAIRHAAARLERQDARTKLLIILSDGRPYDHDYGDSRYAREDTKVALRQAKINNITPFCITIDRESEDQLKDLYGEVGYTIIDNVLNLPERMPGIYRRLTT